MIMERLDMSVFDFIKMNDYRGLPMSCVRSIAGYNKYILRRTNYLQHMLCGSS